MATDFKFDEYGAISFVINLGWEGSTIPNNHLSKHHFKLWVLSPLRSIASTPPLNPVSIRHSNILSISSWLKLN